MNSRNSHSAQWSLSLFTLKTPVYMKGTKRAQMYTRDICSGHSHVLRPTPQPSPTERQSTEVTMENMRRHPAMGLRSHAPCELFRLCGGGRTVSKAESRERRSRAHVGEHGALACEGGESQWEARRPPEQRGLVGKVVGSSRLVEALDLPHVSLALGTI